MTLRSTVDRYRLTLGGCHVWTPYWLNSTTEPFRLDAPLRGKGTAKEVARAARAAARAESVAPQSVEEWGLLMRRHGLGIDCSGFVYHVLSEWLRQAHGLELADYLQVPPAEIEARNARLPALADRWNARRVPPARKPVALSQAARRWGFEPASIVNVLRLTDPAICQAVPAAGLARPGDLIRTSNHGSHHVGIVVSAKQGLITYADSAHADGVIGGVSYRYIAVDRPESGLEQQSWGQKRLYHPEAPGSGDGMWRLTVLAEQVYGRG